MGEALELLARGVQVDERCLRLQGVLVGFVVQAQLDLGKVAALGKARPIPTLGLTGVILLSTLLVLLCCRVEGME